jgi:hypothetical protein
MLPRLQPFLGDVIGSVEESVGMCRFEACTLALCDVALIVGMLVFVGGIFFPCMHVVPICLSPLLERLDGNLTKCRELKNLAEEDFVGGISCIFSLSRCYICKYADNSTTYGCVLCNRALWLKYSK